MNKIEEADAAIAKAKFGSPEYESACQAKIQTEYTWPGPWTPVEVKDKNARRTN